MKSSKSVKQETFIVMNNKSSQLRAKSGQLIVKCAHCPKQMYDGELAVHVKTCHKNIMKQITRTLADLDYKERSLRWAEGNMVLDTIRS